MRDEVHILVYSPIDTFQWGSTHSALVNYNGSPIYENLSGPPGGPTHFPRCYLVFLRKNLVCNRSLEILTLQHLFLPGKKSFL